MALKKVYIEISNRCNLACSFCTPSKLDIKDMSVEEFKHIIEEVRPITRTVYLHVKGEPLWHPQLESLLMVCEHYQMRVHITTNGTLLHTKAAILSTYMCVRKINISLHCEHHQEDYITRVFEGVASLRAGIVIVYRLWTMKDNALDQRGLDCVQALMDHYTIAPARQDDMIRIQNYKLAENVYVDKDNEFVWPSLSGTQKSDGYCFGLKTHVAILAQGDVVPCCLDGEGVIHLGNVHEEALSSILESSRARALKHSFQQRKPCEELCQKCGFKHRFDI